MSLQRRELNTPFNFTPTTLKEAIEYATIFASSDLCPASYKGRPNDVLICWQMGAEMGLGKMQALRTIYCVNGTPSTFGDGQFALVKQHPEFEDAHEWMEGDIKNGTRKAFCTLTRKGQTPQTRSFSMEEVKLAGLWNSKDNWKRYPDNMLKRRARTICSKDVFPDATFGLPSQDEAEEIVQVKATVKSINKGMAGVEESLGIIEVEEAPVVEVISEDEPQVILEEKSLNDRLLYAIFEKNVSSENIEKWCKKFNVSVIADIPDEGKEKIINHIKEKM